MIPAFPKGLTKSIGRRAIAFALFLDVRSHKKGFGGVKVGPCPTFTPPIFLLFVEPQSMDVLDCGALAEASVKAAYHQQQFLF